MTGNKNGLKRCPNCGSSDISQDTEVGKLKCNHCRSHFDGVLANAAGGIRGKTGEDRGIGAEDIIPGEDVVITMKCPSCGAQVVVNTDKATSTKCHWCHHVLSVNEKVSNGAVPDLVLPFKFSKRKAQEIIRKFIDNNTTSVNQDFKNSYKAELVNGVYFPYMIVDVNAKSEMNGYAERTVNKAPVDWQQANYADEYSVSRNFDLLVDDLTVESSSRRLNQNTMINTNYVINTILPFDTENAVAWDANYLRGFTSERRDVNVNSLKQVVALQCGDIARIKIRDDMKEYDRGVRWSKEHLGIKGTKWRAAYLPVWLYSYQREENGRIYYVAVNGRTGEVAGELPTTMHEKKSLVEINNKPGNRSARRRWGWVLIVVGLVAFPIGWLFVIPGICLLIAGRESKPESRTEIALGLTDSGKITRHYHELETRAKIENLERIDDIIKSEKRVYSDNIVGRNDNRVIGTISTGEQEMLEVEKMRFAQKREIDDRTRMRRHNNLMGNLIAIFYVIIMIIIFLAAIMGGGSGSGHHRGSSSSSSSYDSDWGSSSYDWGSSSSDWGSSSYDSGGWDSGGFDYSYDY